ncbi:MAG: MFS transporter [Blastocatellia bacterium]|nr:MFS transporter [Blastocatellia bacterium]
MANFSRQINQADGTVHPNPYIGTLGVFLGAGITTLYGRLLSVGLPDLRGVLGLGIDEGAWLLTTYNMTLMLMGPLSVYLGALLGVRRVLLFAAPLFLLVSLLLPFSPNLGVMFGLQVLAGISSGTFYPLTMSHALRSLPLRFTIYGIGVYSIDILAATSVAVPLEGWFTEHLSWHWIFWCGAILASLMVWCIHQAIPPPLPRTGPKPVIRWDGFLYASFGLSLLFGALDQGERLNWMESGVIVGLVAAGGFLLVAALVRRWLTPNPLVNLRFLKDRNTLMLGASLFSFRFVILAIALLIPGFLGVIHGYRPLETGRVLLWVAVPQLLVAIVSARLMRRVEGHLVLAGGFATVAVACWLNAHLTSTWIGDNFWIPQLVIALGLSLAFVALVGLFVQQGVASGAVARPVDILTFSAFIHVVRLFGGEVGTAGMQYFIRTREQFHSNLTGLHLEVGTWVTDDRMKLLTAGLTGQSNGIDEAQRRALALMGGQVRQQAFTLAYGDGFLVIAWVCVGIIALLAFLKPMKVLFDSDSPNPPG